MQRQAQQVNFLKNVSLAGAALIVMYVYSELGDDAGLSITGPLFV
jgi:uncharacterized membrane protein